MRPLRPQLWVSREVGEQPAPDAIVAVANDDGWVKPKGGLWTSTYLGPDEGSDWMRFARSDLSDKGADWWVLTPDPATRVLTIDSVTDLNRVLKTHGVPPPWQDESWPFARRLYPDYEKLAAEYDAIHLTERGQWRTRLSHPNNLYGWDCESTLWFRWRFASPEKVEPSILDLLP